MENIFDIKELIVSGNVKSIRTGIKDIDYHLGGVHCGETYLILSEPYIGKKTMVANVIRTMLSDNKNSKAAVFLQSNSNIDFIEQFDDKFFNEEYEKRIFLDDTYRLQVDEVAKILEEKAELWNLIVIDGFQNMDIEDDIVYACKRLREIAKKYCAPVIVLCDLKNEECRLFENNCFEIIDKSFYREMDNVWHLERFENVQMIETEETRYLLLKTRKVKRSKRVFIRFIIKPKRGLIQEIDVKEE